MGSVSYSMVTESELEQVLEQVLEQGLEQGLELELELERAQNGGDTVARDLL
jgi:hypothetical protein